MPFDGRTYRRNDPESIKSDFLTWCKAQPPKKFYNYLSNSNCAFSRFLKETGRSSKDRPSNGVQWWDDYGRTYNIPPQIVEALPPLPIFGRFGGLVKRLEANYTFYNVVYI